jgi:hypothetical protein
MEEKLIIRPKGDTPGIILNPSENKFEIYGKSLPEDTNEFFDPVINYFREYSKNPNPVTKFVFNFEYFNSASVRKIVDIISILEDMHQKGNSVRIVWMYEETDEVMKENGDDFQDTTTIKIELKSFQYED